MANFFYNLLVFISWFLVYFFAFCSSNNKVDIICYVVGFIGLLYITTFAWKVFCSPIKRDWLLVSGKFLRKIICLVLFVPFTFSVWFIIKDNNIDKLQNTTSDLLISGEEEKIEITNRDSHIFWHVFYHFIDPGNQHLSITQRGRGLAALISVFGILLLNGLLISTLINWFDTRKNLWRNGEIRYKKLAFVKDFRKNYAVVIGVDANAPTIIKNLLSGRGECLNLDYVIVLTNLDVLSVRNYIYSYLSDEYKKRVIIYRGQLDSLEEISYLYLDEVKEIYVLGEKQIEDVAYSYHDIQNMKIVHNIASYLTEKCVEHRVVCRVLFEYQTTFSIFQFSDLPTKITDHLVFIPFNNYENWAQCVLVKGNYTEEIRKVLPMQRHSNFENTAMNKVLYSLINSVLAGMKKNNIEARTFDYLPLEGVKGFTEETEKYVHFVILGMSKMGIAMALQAAQIAHYPNFKPENGRRTRITFIDTNADKEKDFFMGRFYHMFDLTRYRYLDFSETQDFNADWIDPIRLTNSDYYNICGVSTEGGKEVRHHNFIDLEWEFIKGGIEQPIVKQYLDTMAEEALANKKVLTIAICYPLAHEAIAAALYLPDKVYKSVGQILVYQRETSDMVANITDKNNAIKYYDKIRPFGMEDADFTTDKENYYRAQLANFVYKLIFETNENTDKINTIIERIGNASDKKKMFDVRAEWKKLNMADRWSNKYLANSFETKMRSIGYTATDIELNLDAITKSIVRKKDIMAECEHNRWNVQQLLIGFRAYTNEELKMYLEIKSDKEEERKQMKREKQKGKDKAHLNICSFAKLKEIDNETWKYDEIFNAAIPYILRVTEEARKTRNDKK